MRLKTPQFWYESDSIKTKMLTPLSFFYKAASKLCQNTGTPYKSTIPVICVGNIVSGGSGKTPVSLAIMNLTGTKQSCFLTRGYGGQNKGPLVADKDKHTAADIGDEALLLANKALTIISADRGKGACLAEDKKADLIIMDDGLQNPQLHQDIKIIVIDGATGFGNGKVIPAGPLRESLESGLQKADAFVFIGADKQNIKNMIPKNRPVFDAKITVSENWISDTKIPYIAFSGLAHPEKFKGTLEDISVNIVDWHPYPDHYSFTAQDLETLAAEAKEKKARLITTEKDAARLPRDFVQGNPLDILPIQITWEDREAVIAFLKNKITT